MREKSRGVILCGDTVSVNPHLQVLIWFCMIGPSVSREKKRKIRNVWKCVCCDQLAYLVLGFYFVLRQMFCDCTEVRDSVSI